MLKKEKILLKLLNFGNIFFMHTLKFRFSAFFILSLCLLIMPIYTPFFKSNYNDKATYFYYTTKIDYDIKNAKIINSANNSIIVCDFDNAKNIKKNINNQILSESIRIDNYSQKNYDEILNKYNNYILKTEKVDNYEIIYCYDSSLEKFINIFDKKINIQIAISKNQINIGYPLILNGF